MQSTTDHTQKAGHPTAEEMEQMRRQYNQQACEGHGVQIAVLEQMWLELARVLAEQGALNVEVLAQRLEAHALRGQDLDGWFFGLTEAALNLRQASGDPDSLVQ